MPHRAGLQVVAAVRPLHDCLQHCGHETKDGSEQGVDGVCAAQTHEQEVVEEVVPVRPFPCNQTASESVDGGLACELLSNVICKRLHKREHVVVHLQVVSLE